MTAQRRILEIRRNDPQFHEKALQFFLDVYRETQDWQRQLKARQEPEVQPNAEGFPNWRLGLDNLPDDYLSKEHFIWLRDIMIGIDTLLCLPLPDVTDGRSAAFLLMTRKILFEAQRFIHAIFIFLTLDKHLHPGQSTCVDAVGILGIGETKEEEKMFYDISFTLGISQKVYDILWQTKPATPSFDYALNILRKCGELYFTTLGSIFNIQAISKCQRAFILLLDKIGTTAMEERVKNYVRRRKTMQREIEKRLGRDDNVSQLTAQQNRISNQGPSRQATDQIIASIEKCTEAVQEQTQAVANMDRRTRAFFSYVKRIIAGLVQTLHPAKPKPTPEQVANTLQPPDRYACLERVKEPHRSQIKAVIDHTCNRPIVHGQPHANVYTLAHAVRDTWGENEDKWARVPGTFATVNDLKSACYNMQQGPNDPFCYQAPPGSSRSQPSSRDRTTPSAHIFGFRRK